MPLDGAAGGSPGSTTIYEVLRADGRVERISTKAAGVVLESGDTFEVRTGSSGGVGDPLDRDPAAVARDIVVNRITREEAESAYGLHLTADGRVDAAATAAERERRWADRLARATAPVRVLADDDVPSRGDDEGLPLYPGVVQVGAVAYAERSGAPLALAPAHWTDGCAVLEEPQGEPGTGPAIVIRSYLDPRSGRSLYVESVPAGSPRAFSVLPRRWTDARP
jgi:N-methylhydantoinase B